MITVKSIGYLEYVIVFAGCRTPLSDYYIQNQGSLCRILGAYDSGGGGIGILIYRPEEPKTEILYIGTEPRGMGTGQLLLAEAVRRGRLTGRGRLLLRVCGGNPSAKALTALAEKNGFVLADTMELFQSDIEDYPRWKAYMEKHGYAILKLLQEEGFSAMTFCEAPSSVIEEIRDMEHNTFDRSLDPRRILDGYKGRFCGELSYLSLKDGHPAAYCLVCQPDPEHYVYEIIAAAKEYQNTGAVFLPFAMAVNGVEKYPYRKVGFAMHRKNQKALALSRRMMKSLISRVDLQYNYEYYD